MTYRSSKLLGPYSCAFRQPFADSHCKDVHGYGLTFRFDFEADKLDHNGWVIDFGGLKELNAQLDAMFDHRLVIAVHDPLLSLFRELHNSGGCNLAVYTRVGIESFAEYAHYEAVQQVNRMGHGNRVKVVKVECWEHPKNSAVYIPTI